MTVSPPSAGSAPQKEDLIYVSSFADHLCVGVGVGGGVGVLACGGGWGCGGVGGWVGVGVLGCGGVGVGVCDAQNNFKSINVCWVRLEAVEKETCYALPLVFS